LGNPVGALGIEGTPHRVGGQVSLQPIDFDCQGEHGIVDFITDGRAKRPVLQHDHLVVEPVF
jgi:predicted transcriptional regulator